MKKINFKMKFLVGLAVLLSSLTISLNDNNFKLFCASDNSDLFNHMRRNNRRRPAVNQAQGLIVNRRPGVEELEIRDGRGIRYRLNIIDETASVIRLPESQSSISIPGIVEHNVEGRGVMRFKVTSIEKDAITENNNVTGIIIPESVTHIHMSAINGHNLQNIIVSEDNEKFVVKDNVLFVKKDDGTLSLTLFPRGIQVTEYTIPSEVNGCAVKSIQSYAFCNCLIRVLNLPETLQKIYPYAIVNCVHLRSLTLPEDVALDGHFIDGCDELQSLELPANLTSMDERAKYAICDCPKLSTLIVSEDNEKFIVEDNVLFVKKDDGTLSLTLFPRGIQVTEYTIPSEVNGCAVTEICDYAFYKSVYLEKIMLSEGIRRMEDDSIWQCEELHSLFLPASLIMITQHTINGCHKLSTLELAEGNEKYFSDNNVLFVKKDDNTLSVLFFPSGHKTGENITTEYTVPSEINGYRVTGICDNAFFDGINLKIIILLENLAEVGEEIFGSAECLQSVVVIKNRDLIVDVMECFSSMEYFKAEFMNSNGETIMTQFVLTNNDKPEKAVNPSNFGIKETQWFKDDGQEFDFDTQITKDMVLYSVE